MPVSSPQQQQRSVVDVEPLIAVHAAKQVSGLARRAAAHWVVGGRIGEGFARELRLPLRIGVHNPNVRRQFSVAPPTSVV